MGVLASLGKDMRTQIAIRDLGREGWEGDGKARFLLQSRPPLLPISIAISPASIKSKLSSLWGLFMDRHHWQNTSP